MAKHFIHIFVPGSAFQHMLGYPDSVGVNPIPLTSWAIDESGVTVEYPAPNVPGKKELARYGFYPGARYYIVVNEGECMEPNGRIIWRYENGGFGDEKAAA